MEECLRWLARIKAYASCHQETWKLGTATEQNGDFVILNNGPTAKLCRRGSLGVSIVLSKRAKQAWEDAGCQVHCFGLRVLATRLSVRDKRGVPVTILLVSAYSPIGSAPKAEREAYWDQLQACIDTCAKGEVLVIGTDANASAGRRSCHDNAYAAGRDQVRGPFGEPHENTAGKELCSFSAVNGLCLPSTYFRKRHYVTWQNPCNKNWHQLDHFLVTQKDLKRVQDVGRINERGTDSDHFAVGLRLRVCKTLKKQRPPVDGPPAVRIDRKFLRDEGRRQAFLDKVKANMARDSNGANKVQHAERALRDAGDATLATVERKQPSWWDAYRHELEYAINARNAAQECYSKTNTAQSKQQLKRLRKNVKRQVLAAQRAWLRAQMDRIDGLANGNLLRSPKDAWKAISELKCGKSMTKKLKSMVLEGCKTPAENAERMVGYQAKVFNKLGTFDPAALDLVRQRDPNLFAWMAEEPDDSEISKAVAKLSSDRSASDTKVPAEFWKACEEDPDTRTIIRDIVREVWTSGSWQEPEPEPIPPEPPPPMSPPPPPPPPASPPKRRSSRSHNLSHEALIAIANTVVRKPKKAKVEFKEPEIPKVFQRPPVDPDADKDGVMYPEWMAARLKLLPKKGDLAQCKNWRGICLLDIASKIFSNILVARLQKVQEHMGLEAQCGFRGFRGTIDGLFNASVSLQKRKEHNLETWALYIDLVKAFDGVSREALWIVMRKFGLPDHFINLVIRLHTGATIKLKIGDIDSDIPSTIGVRQGSCEGPALFLFMIQAALETMEWPAAKPSLCTREEGPITGAKWNRKQGVTTFDLWSSLFADDCALLFETRSDMIAGANYIAAHFKRFGLLMHVGRDQTKSKTEAVFYPAPRQPHSAGDQTDFACDGDGFISFTSEFIYLGSVVHSSLTCDADVDRRIAKASAAFGALRQPFFNSRIPSLEDKGRVFVALCLSILLYGSECWCLKESQLQRLRVYYNRCVRSMCKVNMKQVRFHRIPTKSLLGRLSIRPLEYYYTTRLLRWTGHVARMPMTRTPRRLLTSWANHRRPVGAPQMTIGRTINKALSRRNIPTDFKTWSALAQDRGSWRNAIDPLRTNNK
jgi:hypothetical protein